MKDIEITIKNDYINILRQATTSTPKLRTYITFKKSFNIEHYLLLLTNIKDITAMAKLPAGGGWPQINVRTLKDLRTSI